VRAVLLGSTQGQDRHGVLRIEFGKIGADAISPVTR
jgi:hypothetical protein